MRLPYSVEFGYFNYVLSVTNRLTQSQQTCDIRILIDTCKAQVFNGRIDVKYHEVINLCQYAGLLYVVKRRVKLTSIGSKFLDLNPNDQFEFTDLQKDFFIKNFIFSGAWKKQVKSIFKAFVADSEEFTFNIYVGKENNVPVELRAQLYVFYCLGILEQKGDFFLVVPKYVRYIIVLRAEETGLSQEELEERLKRNHEKGSKAEELIMAYEKARLRALGRNAEADRVVLISQMETDAGYDIRSFNGNKPALEYDRYIEVKSSENTNLSFHWSLNEIQISEQLGEKYWIYFVGGFNIESNYEEIVPILIQNPHEKLFDHKDIVCKPNNYRVYQKNEVPLQDLNYFEGKYI